MWSEIPSGKVLQIIPAPANMYAVYRDDDGGEDMKMPLVCVALVEDDGGERNVVFLECDDFGSINEIAFHGLERVVIEK